MKKKKILKMIKNMMMKMMMDMRKTLKKGWVVHYVLYRDFPLPDPLTLQCNPHMMTVMIVVIMMAMTMLMVITLIDSFELAWVLIFNKYWILCLFPLWWVLRQNPFHPTALLFSKPANKKKGKLGGIVKKTNVQRFHIKTLLKRPFEHFCFFVK